ncbi:Pre Qo pathway QueC-like protein [Arthrobacter phage Sonali]|uniref:7-cyano-7-deazaguanine synthase n=1 Tax=Arthrobacter phage Sonali TaxID=2510495 RepID=A0A411CQY0_9CAUD|nr:QueC-like queuosine biosynthesis [Arthrobacter phage Sonali]QAY16200.1 Pre Qo pathway QueC-like protein [Arthrobacter phage Sonali]
MTNQLTPRPKQVVLLSGGMDSTALLALAYSRGDVLGALSVNYGQRHVKELDAARAIADHYGVPHLVLDMTSWGSLLSGSALTDPEVEVPEGHYAAPNMAITVVPNRNATMLMAAAGVAESLGAEVVLTAVHAGDHAVYPDCRPEFIAAASLAARLGTGGKVSIDAPFVGISKTDIANVGATLRAPFELTWSCYKGGENHCGACGTCVERREAFTDSGVTDPTIYDTPKDAA